MILLNVSAAPVTLAGEYVVQPGQTITLAYSVLETDRNFLSYIDAQQLRIISAEEGFTLFSVPRFTQGTWIPSTQVLAGKTQTPMTNNGTTQLTLWVAPFQIVRLYLNVLQGDMSVALFDSPDGGTTLYPVLDPAIQGQTTSMGGLSTYLLPQGLCLLTCTLSSMQGGIALVQYSRQAT